MHVSASSEPRVPPPGRRLLIGLFAGTLAAIPACLILWGAWMLPLLGLVLTRVNLWSGVASVTAVAAAGGLLYGLTVGALRLTLPRAALAGMLFGILVWVGAALVLVELGASGRL